MAFSDEVAAHSKTRLNTCKVCLILESVEPNERKEIESVMADKSIAGAPICRALNARGYDVGEATVRKHRDSCVL